MVRRYRRPAQGRWCSLPIDDRMVRGVALVTVLRLDPLMTALCGYAPRKSTDLLPLPGRIKRPRPRGCTYSPCAGRGTPLYDGAGPSGRPTSAQRDPWDV